MDLGGHLEGGLSFTGSFQGISSSGTSAAVYSALEQVSSALTWFAPILLTYAIVKILIENNPKRFTAISRKIASIFSSKTNYLVATNITRNPKRSAALLLLLQ